jgi:hypothetical protein
MYRDKVNVPVVVGDTIEYNDKKYVVRFIMSYPVATVVIVEKLDKTHQVETLLLRDVKKI